MFERQLPDYTVEISEAEALPDGGVLYAARFAEIKTCIGQGNSPEEAEAALRKVLPRFLERMEMAGVPIPAPRRPFQFVVGQGTNATSSRTVRFTVFDLVVDVSDRPRVKPAPDMGLRPVSC